MPEPTENTPRAKFHAMFYNFIAKRIREQFDVGRVDDTPIMRYTAIANRATLSDLALACAVKFAEDNPSFDPLKFLDQCSPDTEQYPLSELWDDPLDELNDPNWKPQEC